MLYAPKHIKVSLFRRVH